MTEEQELTLKLCAQLERNEPIDPKALDYLQQLRYAKNKAIAERFPARLEEMKKHTSDIMERLYEILTDNVVKSHPDVMEKVYAMQEEYDLEAAKFVQGVEPWEDSKAAEIAAGLLILANEIR